MPDLRGVCRKRSQPIRNLCYFNLPCLLVLEKPHSISTCPVSSISSSVTVSISHSSGTPEILFSIQDPYHLYNEGFCFLTLTWGNELSAPCLGCIFFLHCLWVFLLYPLLSHKKAFLFKSLLRLIDPTCQWPDNGSLTLIISERKKIRAFGWLSRSSLRLWLRS